MKQLQKRIICFFQNEKRAWQCPQTEVAYSERPAPGGYWAQQSIKRISLLLCICLFGSFFYCADYDLLDDKNAPPTPKLIVSAVRDSTVTLSWTQYANENFKSYKVYYDTSDVVDYTSTFVDSLVFGQDTVKTVRGLKPATRYYFRVFTTNQAARTSASNIAIGITWLAFQPSQRLGDTAILLKWTALKNCPLSGYRLYRDTTASVDTLDSLIAQIGSGDTTHAVGDLQAGKTWYFRAYAIDDSCFLTASTISQASGWWFQQNTPAKFSDTAVTISWAQVANGVQQYTVFRNSSSPVDTTDTLCATVNASAISTTVGNLVKGNKYFFKVYAKGVSGYIGWTREGEITLSVPTPLARRSANR